MGLMDRDYYRNEPTSTVGWPGGSTYPATVALIVVHVVGFVLTVLQGDGFAQWLALLPAEVRAGQLWRLVTYPIIPAGGAWALLWNMLFLWWFGREVESLYGSANYVAVYIIGAMVGGIAAVLTALAPAVPEVAMAGASAPILAVLVVYALWYPRHRIYFFGLFPIEIRWLVAIYVGIDLLNVAAAREALLPIALARLATAAWGAIVKTQNLRPADWATRLWRGMSRPRPRLRVVPPPDAAELEEELDRLLAKVQQSGIDGLTPDERSRLEALSRELKRRRAL